MNKPRPVKIEIAGPIRIFASFNLVRHSWLSFSSSGEKFPDFPRGTHL